MSAPQIGRAWPAEASPGDVQFADLLDGELVHLLLAESPDARTLGRKLRSDPIQVRAFPFAPPIEADER